SAGLGARRWANLGLRYRSVRGGSGVGQAGVHQGARAGLTSRRRADHRVERRQQCLHDWPGHQGFCRQYRSTSINEREMMTVIVLAHRGYSAKAPENTMAAFELALAVGADGIELDVHMTRDGEIVVIHDDTLDRTTNGKGPVSDQTM